MIAMHLWKASFSRCLVLYAVATGLTHCAAVDARANPSGCMKEEVSLLQNELLVHSGIQRDSMLEAEKTKQSGSSVSSGKAHEQLSTTTTTTCSCNAAAALIQSSSKVQTNASWIPNIFMNTGCCDCIEYLSGNDKCWDGSGDAFQDTFSCAQCAVAFGMSFLWDSCPTDLRCASNGQQCKKEGWGCHDDWDDCCSGLICDKTLPYWDPQGHFYYQDSGYCSPAPHQTKTNMNSWYADRDATSGDCAHLCHHNNLYEDWCEYSVFNTNNAGSCKLYNSFPSTCPPLVVRSNMNTWYQNRNATAGDCNWMCKNDSRYKEWCTHSSFSILDGGTCYLHQCNADFCQNGIRNQDACCDLACGSCGGDGCGGRPGGPSKCCVGAITSNNGRFCISTQDVACKIPNPSTDTAAALIEDHVRRAKSNHTLGLEEESKAGSSVSNQVDSILVRKSCQL